MKYVNQLEHEDLKYITRLGKESEEEREKGQRSTIKSSGCGLCCSVMIADRLLVDSNFELEDAIQLSYEAKSNYLKGTTYKIYAPVFAERLGLKVEMTNDPERLRYCLRTGGAAVIHCGGDHEGGVFFSPIAGHYVAAISEEPDGRIAILDPSYKVGKYETESRKGKVEIKNNVIAICDMQVLVEDTAGRNPGFYLFWRK